jgi:hypothetical protein
VVCCGRGKLDESWVYLESANSSRRSVEREMMSDGDDGQNIKREEASIEAS